MSKLYKFGYVYKYSCGDFEDFYIGSTVNTNRRRNDHRTRFNCNTKKCNDKFYDFIRNNESDIKNWNMEILETFNDITLKELHIKEQTFLNELKPTLNKIKSNTTKEEKRITMCEISQRYRKKYPEKNKAYQEEYRKIRCDCDCGKSYLLPHKQRHFKTKYHIDNV